MSANEDCPVDFSAVVVTPPADVGKFALDDLLANAEDLMKDLEDFTGHRVIYAQQVEQADSSTVATLMELARRAHDHDCEFVICNPPKMLDNYLDIYLPGDDRHQAIFYTEKDEPSDCPVPWLPDFQPSRNGRIDIWKDGHWQSSYTWTHDGLRPG